MRLTAPCAKPTCASTDWNVKAVAKEPAFKCAVIEQRRIAHLRIGWRPRGLLPADGTGWRQQHGEQTKQAAS